MPVLFRAFVGIDVSKRTLDFHVLNGSLSGHCQCENSIPALTTLFQTNLLLLGLKGKKVLFCFEQTSIYHYPLIDFLSKKKAAFSVQNGLHVKLSMGLVRGKSDKADAERIAQFAAKNAATLRLWQAPRPVIHSMHQLLSIRKRLTTVRIALQTPVKESRYFISNLSYRELAESYPATLAALKQDLAVVERKLLETVQQDERLNSLYQIITSVDYIGFITAIHLIVVTNEFLNFETAAKFASYIGIAPFARTSGTSLNSRSRVLGYGNKEIKSLLHLAAMRSLAGKGHLRQYYDRKKAEGKHAFLVMNAIKNKLIRQIFCCVRENRLSANSR